MSVSRFNSEGYHDPVVYEALTNMEKEQRAAVRAASAYRPLVYESATINWTDFLRAYTMNPYEERNFNYVREKTT